MSNKKLRPVEYTHEYKSMQRFGSHLELQGFRRRTIHGYYRRMRLLAAHFWKDPARLNERELRDYHVYTRCGGVLFKTEKLVRAPTVQRNLFPYG